MRDVYVYVVAIFIILSTKKDWVEGLNGIELYVVATFTSIFPACMEQNIISISFLPLTQSSNYFHGKDSFFNYLAV